MKSLKTRGLFRNWSLYSPLAEENFDDNLEKVISKHADWDGSKKRISLRHHFNIKLQIP